MKRIFLGMCCTILIIAFLQVPACAAETSWTKATDHAAFSPRLYFSMASFADKMWVIGGSDSNGVYLNDVWYSTDGITWNLATGSAPFTPRYGHTTVVFDNKMWVIGGYDSSHQFRSDVWYTTDGTTWTLATQKAAFQPRVHFTSVVYDRRMWVIGGEITEKPWVYTKDVWYSIDGKTWLQATNSAPFTPRAGHGSAVINEKMYVLGGVGDAYGDVRYNDVWSSTDGKNWEKIINSAGFSPRYSSTTSSMADTLWVIGGDGGGKALADIWSSSDGKTWLSQSPVNGFSPRFCHGTVLFNDRLWIVGGANQANQYFNDVWHSSAEISPAFASGIVVNKSVSPWSIKQGTDARVSITFTNAGNSPVNDVEILDTSISEFPIVGGTNQTLIPQVLMPNETRLIVYTIHSTKPGKFTLPKALVMYADSSGNYHKIQSDAASIEVLEPLVNSEKAVYLNEPGSFFERFFRDLAGIFSSGSSGKK